MGCIRDARWAWLGIVRSTGKRGLSLGLNVVGGVRLGKF